MQQLAIKRSITKPSNVAVSNPTMRRLELIRRVKGFELVTKEMKHEALFTTVITPSDFK
jgi:hypothetical protein